MNQKLSHRVSAWSTLPTAALHGKILELQNAGENIIDLTIGISNRPIPKEGEYAAIEAITTNHVPYTAIGGTSALKKAIQQKLARENKIVSDPSNIIVSTGAKQTIFQALYAITNPADEIMVFSPYWAAYTQMANMLQLKPLFVGLDEIVSLPQKKISDKMKVFILNNPHNPSGKVFTKKELMMMASFAKKNNVYMLVDESYEKLIYEGKHISFLTIDPSLKEQVITIFSVSQTFSMMGWRLGYAVASKEIIQAMEAVQSSITAGASAVTQTAVEQIMNMDNNYITDLTADFNHRKNTVFEKLAAIDWIEVQNPKSGPYFWCNIKKLTHDSLAFCTQFLEEKKVAIMPGDSFGGPGFIRIGFNVQPVEVLETAITRLSGFGEQYLANSSPKAYIYE